ncbi:flagellar hook capping protein [Paenibacillus sp. GSMTC-2017]|uniref:flagellar hook capping FlgD N-terminal domain-containing protein n=1 Tax=Paenibacillus sp. GSMTC-2017 TaxID=2794350 RepID=UPI0018D86A1E|nr:flagellar hook capping FlgD N-terminal domain-containing protein [Paenibacillus sp. GSMTC-2017]MBH5316638.1 flagellar hook capping protein [Paenibacillus sp. GSMTC-2017]
MAESVSTKTVWPHYDKKNVLAAASRQPSDALGKDQFLSILVTQLRNQDPMQPMQDKDFIAQMAQFTSVEQLMNMSTELSLMRQSIGSASSLIGKWIQWNEYDDKGAVTAHKGIADSIVSKDGLLFAKVGEKEIALDYVVSISETEPIVPEKPEKTPTDGDGAKEEVVTP